MKFFNLNFPSEENSKKNKYTAWEIDLQVNFPSEENSKKNKYTAWEIDLFFGDYCQMNDLLHIY